jgi:hypothetical protein
MIRVLINNTWSGGIIGGAASVTKADSGLARIAFILESADRASKMEWVKYHATGREEVKYEASFGFD